MFKNESTKKLMSMAIAAMFMLCAFSVCLGADMDDATDANGTGTSADPYIINIRNGQEFEYTPTVNLTGATIAMATPSPLAANFDTTTNTLTYAPTNVTDGSSETVHLVATWNNGTLTQTADQYIQFNVYNQTEISATLNGAETTYSVDGSKTINVIVGNSPIVFNGYNYTITMGDSPSEATIDYSDFSTGPFNFEAVTGGFKVVQTEMATATGVYTGSVTVSSTVGNDTQEITLSITINVADKIALDIADGLILQTFDGATGTQGGSTNSFTATVTTASDTDFSDIDFDITAGAGAPTGFFTITEPTVSWDSTKSGVTTNDQYKDNTFTVRVTGTYPGTTVGAPDVESTDSKDVTVRTYAKLVFTNAPQIPTFSAVVGQGAFANDVTVSASFIAAKKIVYNWGDGTSTSTNVAMSDVAKNYSAHHIYSTAGAYQVSITAINDFGETVSHLLVTANGFGALGDPIEIKNAAGDKIGTITPGDDNKISLDNLADIVSAKFNAETQKIVALYKVAPGDNGFDANQKFDLSQAVTAETTVLYADVQDKNLFDYHGWDFIVLAVLAILAVIVYFYVYCHPVMPILAVIFAILAVASYLCGGITEIIPAIQAAFASWFPPQE